MKWIKLTEQVPEFDKHVLVKDEDNKIYVAALLNEPSWRDIDNNYDVDGVSPYTWDVNGDCCGTYMGKHYLFFFTHWCYLPEIEE